MRSYFTTWISKNQKLRYFCRFLRLFCIFDRKKSHEAPNMDPATLSIAAVCMKFFIPISFMLL